MRPPSIQTNIQWIARVGYAARGMVYLLAGIFSFSASITGSGDSVGPKGALGKAFELPFGDAIFTRLPLALFALRAGGQFKASTIRIDLLVAQAALRAGCLCMAEARCCTSD